SRRCACAARPCCAGCKGEEGRCCTKDVQSSHFSRSLRGLSAAHSREGSLGPSPLRRVGDDDDALGTASAIKRGALHSDAGGDYAANGERRVHYESRAEWSREMCCRCWWIRLSDLLQVVAKDLSPGLGPLRPCNDHQTRFRHLAPRDAIDLCALPIQRECGR